MPKFHVDRSITINAAPEKVHDTVADFGTWTTWSPWLCAEPDATVTVTDDASSVGSVYAWKGEVVGQGEIEHKQLERGRLIDQEIRFLKPWKSVSHVAFRTQPAEGGARITWNMDGSLPWFMFWMKPMMKAFIGMDYERGLRMLKEYIETGHINAKTHVQGIESVGPLKVIGVRSTCSTSDVGASMEKTFSSAGREFERHGLPMDGDMISVYHCFDIKGQTFDYTGGHVVPESTSVPAGLSSWSLPQCRALHVAHEGSYNHLGNSWSAANQHARYKKLKQSKVGTFEIYRNPQESDESKLRTDIYLPLK